METTKKSLVTKLAEVMGEVGHVPKNGKNAHFGYSFATEADVVAAVREKMAARSIMLIPSVEKTEFRSVPGAKGPKQVCTLTVKFTLMDGDSDKTIEFTIIGEGEDAIDKSAFKAMTGAEKYAVMKLFMIPTGDDPEKDTEQPPPRRAQSAIKPATATANAPAQDGAAQSQARTRAKRIWDGAKLLGMDRTAFGKWISIALGSEKKSEAWTHEDMDRLEYELHQMRNPSKEAQSPA